MRTSDLSGINSFLQRQMIMRNQHLMKKLAIVLGLVVVLGLTAFTIDVMTENAAEVTTSSVAAAASAQRRQVDLPP